MASALPSLIIALKQLSSLHPGRGLYVGVDSVKPDSGWDKVGRDVVGVVVARLDTGKVDEDSVAAVLASFALTKQEQAELIPDT